MIWFNTSQLLYFIKFTLDLIWYNTSQLLYFIKFTLDLIWYNTSQLLYFIEFTLDWICFNDLKFWISYFHYLAMLLAYEWCEHIIIGNWSIIYGPPKLFFSVLCSYLLVMNNKAFSHSLLSCYSQYSELLSATLFSVSTLITIYK